MKSGRIRQRWEASAIVVLGISVVVVAAGASRTSAGEVTLKNGLVINGVSHRLGSLVMETNRRRVDEPVSLPFLLIENGYQRIFVPRTQAQKVDEGDDLGKYETFTLKPHRNGSKRTSGLVVETSTFNQYGQRTHMLQSEQGTVPVVVGIKKITPKYISLMATSYQWDYGIATNSIPPEQLDPIIRHASDLKNPDHRFSIARFFLQAGFYGEAGKELDSIAKDFPELAPRVTDARKELQDYEQRLIVLELARRKAAGQHDMAHAFALQIPQQDASATVLHDVRDLIKDYETGRERIAKARSLLNDLQSKLDDSSLSAAVNPLRTVIDEQLTMESLDRLQAFFNLVDDATLRPEEKLALAYSGWVVGSASAVTDLHLAVRLWTAQHLILEYLRDENPHGRKERLAELTKLDGVGPDMVVKLIRCLPPVIETPDIHPGEAALIRVAARESETVPTYGLLLPPEYDSRHLYPMIVTLHPLQRSAKAELDYWGGTLAKPGMAQQRGYIVIAPEYADPNAHQYEYSVTAHDAVLRAIVDARKRFSVDSDRIFLTGHGMGADAAFDIGMSHPDYFAGVIPINGICEQSCRWYVPNAAYTSWYVVVGEFDGRDPYKVDAPALSQMMQKGMDVVLVEFVQRPDEPYLEEVPRIFDWMSPLRRRKPPREFLMKVLRPSESRFYYLRADGLPQSVLEPVFLAGPARGTVRPMSFGVKITPGNTIYVTSGAKSHTLWLSPDLVNFENRVVVKYHGVQKYYGRVQPSTEAILEDFRHRGDRQIIYTVRLDLE